MSSLIRSISETFQKWTHVHEKESAEVAELEEHWDMMQTNLGLTTKNLEEFHDKFMSAISVGNSRIDVSTIVNLINDQSLQSIQRHEVECIFRDRGHAIDSEISFAEFCHAFSAERQTTTAETIDDMSKDLQSAMEKRRRSPLQRVRLEGVYENDLIQYVENEVREMDACLQLPWIVLLLTTFTLSFVLHGQSDAVYGLDQSKEYDVRENANFAFVGNQPRESGRFGAKGLDDVNNVGDFWSWFNLGLVPLLYRDELPVNEVRDNIIQMCRYENVPSEECKAHTIRPSSEEKIEYMFRTFLVGGVRIRQEMDGGSRCNGDFPYDRLGRCSSSVSSEHTGFMEPHPWEPYVLNTDAPSEEMFLPLRVESDAIKRITADLENKPWITQATKRIDVNFASYHPDKKIVSMVYINFFFSFGGRIWKSFTSTSIPINQYSFWGEWVVDIAWVLQVFRILVAEVKDLRTHIKYSSSAMAGLRVYASFWNLLDWVTITSSGLVLVWFGVWMFQVNKVQAFLKLADPENENGWNSAEDRAQFFTEMDIMSVTDYQFRCALSFYVFILGGRLFKAFAGQPRLAVVTRTLYKGVTDLIHFGVVFLSVFFTFAISGNILFGHELASFSNVGRSVITCWRMLNGDFDVGSKGGGAWTDMVQAGSWLAALWFTLFCVIIIWLFMNMLLAIVMDSYTEVKASISGNSETIWSQVFEIFVRWKRTREGNWLALDSILLILDPTVDEEDGGRVKTADIVYTVESLVRKVPGLSRHQAQEVLVGVLETVDAAKTTGSTLSDAVKTIEKTEGMVTELHERMQQLIGLMCASHVHNAGALQSQVEEIRKENKVGGLVAMQQAPMFGSMGTSNASLVDTCPDGKNNLDRTEPNSTERLVEAVQPIIPVKAEEPISKWTLETNGNQDEARLPRGIAAGLPQGNAAGLLQGNRKVSKTDDTAGAGNEHEAQRPRGIAAGLPQGNAAEIPHTDGRGFEEENPSLTLLPHDPGTFHQSSPFKSNFDLRSQPAAHAHKGQDMVQFASPVHYYLEAEEPKLFVDVVRVGEATTRCTVDYETVEGSALAGIKYMYKSGTVEFKPGETRKEIRIDMLQDDAFDATTRFSLQLSNVTGASIRRYLDKVDVFVADDDLFPTNNIDKWYAKDKSVESVPALKLLKEYAIMCMRSHALMCSMGAVMALDQVRNVLFIWKIMLMSFLLDGVLQMVGTAEFKGDSVPIVALVDLIFPSAMTSISKDPDKAVVILMFLNMVPSISVFALSRWKILQSVRGQAINQMQGNLVRKYLYYDEAAHAQVSAADFTMAVIRDVPVLADTFCNSVFDIAQSVGLLAFLGMTALGQTASMNWWETVALFLSFPICGLTFLHLRQKGSARRQLDVFRKETAITKFTQTVTSCYRVIADYEQRGSATRIFEAKVDLANSAYLSKFLWDAVNNNVAPFLTALSIVVFVLLTYAEVLHGGPIGVFVTGITIWEAIGKTFQGLYEDWQLVLSAVGPLQNICHYMNMTTDLSKRAGFHEIALQQSKDLHIKAINQTQYGAATAFDTMELVFADVSFEYGGSFGRKNKPIFNNFNFRIDSGQLVAVTGKRGSGKATLLSLIGGVFLPGKGSTMFIPPHARLLHVNQQPLIIPEIGLFANLTFGNGDERDECVDRVLRICTRLGISEKVLEHIKADAQGEPVILGQPRNDPCKDTNTGKMTAAQEEDVLLSHSDYSLIHFARALICNPEVLVIHKPTDTFSERHSKIIVELLREFVDNRGLEQTKKDYRARRPRTCIFSLPFESPLAEGADMVLVVGGGEVKKVDEKKKKFNERVRNLFDFLDADNDTWVTQKEFLDGLKHSPGYADLLQLSPKAWEEPDEEVDNRLKTVFEKDLDSRSDGRIDFDELLRGLRRRNLANLSQYHDDQGRVKHGHVCTHQTRSSGDDQRSNGGAEEGGSRMNVWKKLVSEVDIPVEAAAPRATASTFGMQECDGKPGWLSSASSAT